MATIFQHLRLLTGSALVVILQAGCASNVMFTDGERRIDHDDVSIFLDRNGNFYPSHRIDVTDSLLRTSAADAGDLKQYFRNRAQEAEWKALLRDTDIQELQLSLQFEELWEKSQNVLRKNLVKSIATRSQEGKRRVVFFIHGFNNNYDAASNWYSSVALNVSKVVRQHGGTDPLIVRIHWDGLKQSIPFGIWTMAQRNGPVVGVSVRKLLRDLDSQLPGALPIAILTHSTGALVAVNAVGNGSAPFIRKDLSPSGCDGDAEFEQACLAIADDSSLPSLHRYRLGLLIPAASLETFDMFNANADGPQAIVLGANYKDVATSKGPLPCLLMGATCLNTWSMNTCRELKNKFQKSPRIKTAFFEFSKSKLGDAGNTFLFWEKHDMEAQMKRDRWLPFIRTVLFEDATETDDSDRCPQ